MFAGSSCDSLPCFNKYAPLADIEDDYCDDNMQIINQYIADHDCSFAALGGGVDDLVDPSTTSERNDKFDTFLVTKKMSFDTISQVKACKDYTACKNQMGRTFWCYSLVPFAGVYWKKDWQ